MLTLKELQQLSTNREITAGEIRPILYWSEGQHGSRHVNSVGHALQHIKVLLHKSTPDPHVLKSQYHRRGPMRFNQRTQAVQQMSGPKSHSQFEDDDQAADLIARALNSVGGRVALFKLGNESRTVKLTFGLTSGQQTVSRAAHVLRDPSGPESNYNFVLINPYTASSVVVELHHSRRVANQLHIQSAYPSGEDIGASKSVVAVTTHPSKTVTESSFNG